ncbi:MAG: histidine kinase N-terminal domain-containing protein [Anaerolineae bacterium]
MTDASWLDREPFAVEQNTNGSHLPAPAPDQTSDFLERVKAGMSIAADISRADIVLFQLQRNELVVMAHAMPVSISSLYRQSALHRTYHTQEHPLVMEALTSGAHRRRLREVLTDGAPVDEEVWPVIDGNGVIVAAFSVLTNLIEHERHRRRKRIFQTAMRWLKWMAVHGELRGAEDLSPFHEFDGILYVNEAGSIEYLSGIAINLYRRVGYLEDMRRRGLSGLATNDEAVVARALRAQRCLEETVEFGDHYWVHKAVPLRQAQPQWQQPRTWFNPHTLPLVPAGAFLLIHDATEARHREQELKIKSALIKEVHHRVKNNLSSVASLVRMQARRIVTVEDARAALADTEERIRSIAIIHEYLAREEGRPISMREVCQRIAEEVKRIEQKPGQVITITLAGPSLHLASRQATACSLAINELISNAIEHSTEPVMRDVLIDVVLEDGGDFVRLQVTDDGPGLPHDFNLQTVRGLGLQIVRTLAQEDLKGKFEIRGNIPKGTTAIVEFPKASLADA